MTCLILADSYTAVSAMERKTQCPPNLCYTSLTTDQLSVTFSLLNLAIIDLKTSLGSRFVLLLLAASCKRDITILEPPFCATVKDGLSFNAGM